MESELIYNRLDAFEDMPENMHSFSSVEDVIKEINDRQNNQINLLRDQPSLW